MCVSDIVLYPERGLRAFARDVDVINDEVSEVIAGLEETMEHYSHCVGLAANQIGSDLNIFVADASKNSSAHSKYDHVVVINARIVSKSDMEIMREGCMSVPDLTGNVSRAKNIVIEGLNESGEFQQFELSDFEARVFQHEIDHLNGKVFLDRVKSARDVFSRKSYRK